MYYVRLQDINGLGFGRIRLNELIDASLERTLDLENENEKRRYIFDDKSAQVYNYIIRYLINGII